MKIVILDIAAAVPTSDTKFFDLARGRIAAEVIVGHAEIQISILNHREHSSGHIDAVAFDSVVGAHDRDGLRGRNRHGQHQSPDCRGDHDLLYDPHGDSPRDDAIMTFASAAGRGKMQDVLRMATVTGVKVNGGGHSCPPHTGLFCSGSAGAAEII